MEKLNRMISLTNIVLVLAGTTTALMAGLFYAWSCSVNLGLAKLSDEGYLTAMQEINRAILNPVFFAGFFGALVLLPLSAYLHYSQPVQLKFWLLVAAALCYIIGTFGVTIFGNVPLNNALDAFNLKSATAEAMRLQRSGFEATWNSLNTIRAVAATIAIVLLIIACLYPNGGQTSN
nr:anthrone oxygenase family protein [uncultured Pedobacter sp.]